MDLINDNENYLRTLKDTGIDRSVVRDPDRCRFRVNVFPAKNVRDRDAPDCGEDPQHPGTELPPAIADTRP